ncbi:MAG: hypothetical protein AB7N65_24100 [Vicinamibacterales bacterium]
MQTSIVPGDPVTCDEIRWTSEPVHRTEDDDLLDLHYLTLDELRAYTYDQRRDLRWVRKLLHAALADVVRLTQLLLTKDRIIAQQRDEIRALRGRP